MRKRIFWQFLLFAIVVSLALTFLEAHVSPYWQRATGVGTALFLVGLFGFVFKQFPRREKPAKAKRLDTLQSLIEAQVQDIQYQPHQLQIQFIGGKGRFSKAAYLVIEVPFSFTAEHGEQMLDPGNESGLLPLAQLKHRKVTAIDLSDDGQEITILLRGNIRIAVKPVPRYEAWNLSGEDLPHYTASPK